MVNNFPNCVPQEQYKPDEDVQRYECAVCGNRDIEEEEIEAEDGFNITKFWCDDCEDYVSVIEL